jgi:hypothetical protein
LSVGSDKSRLNDVEFRTPTKLALYQLKFCDPAFRLAIGADAGDRRQDRSMAFDEAVCE